MGYLIQKLRALYNYFSRQSQTPARRSQRPISDFYKELESIGCKVDLPKRIIKTNRPLDRVLYSEWKDLIRDFMMIEFPFIGDDGDIKLIGSWKLEPLEIDHDMKIIFLDVDGVLNVIGQGCDEYGQIFHQHFVDNLKRIIDATGAKIVISSSWRKSGLKIMQEMWINRGLPGEVIDVTPSLYLKKGGSIQFWNDKLERHPTEKIRGYSIPRGCEIEYWLNNENGKYNIESYVILDDDTDMLLSQHENFVRCSGNINHEDCIDIGYGLTSKCADAAISILNRTSNTLDLEAIEAKIDYLISTETPEEIDGWYKRNKNQ